MVQIFGGFYVSVFVQISTLTNLEKQQQVLQFWQILIGKSNHTTSEIFMGLFIFGLLYYVPIKMPKIRMLHSQHLTWWREEDLLDKGRWLPFIINVLGDSLSFEVVDCSDVLRSSSSKWWKGMTLLLLLFVEVVVLASKSSVEASKGSQRV